MELKHLKEPQIPSLCLFFKLHQPYQLKQYHPKDIEVDHCYEDTEADRASISKLADDCYLPTNNIILSLIHKTRGAFKVSYSLSGTVIELLVRYRPDVIDSFRDLVATGGIEILGETHYHSLSSLYSRREFDRQVSKHRKLIKELFGIEVTVFRNTELIYNNELAQHVSNMGFKAILCEGVESILQGRSCNRIYSAPETGEIRLFLRNVALSDDIAFRFDNKNWDKHPLTAEKFADWIHAHPKGTESINLFMDYETFGIHKRKESGIFDFLKAMPAAILSDISFQFNTPSEVLKQFESTDKYDVRDIISWENKSLSVIEWSQNAMQNNTLKKIYSLEKMVLATGSKEAIDIWGKLQAADYFYYMADEQIKVESYKFLNPFNSSKEVYQYYTNIVVDFEISLIRKQIENYKKNKIKTAVRRILDI